MTIPRHVQTMLLDTGVMDTDRVTARPRTRRCPDCRATVVAALADDGPQAPGIRATVDPAPLTPLGELQATLLHRATFLLAGGGMAWRSPTCITRLPAGTDPRRTVHAEHDCGAVLDHTVQPPRYSVAATDPDNPPY